MAVLLPALAKARTQAKRIVCLSGLKQLVLGWMSYAENNDGKLVNGGQAGDGTGPYAGVVDVFWCTPLCNAAHPLSTSDDVGSDWPAIRYDWDTKENNPTNPLPYAERVSLLRRGALYKYCQNVKSYRCPEVDKDEHRAYVMPSSMNGQCKFCASGTGPVVKNLGQIKSSKDRVVFFEEPRISTDAFNFPYYNGTGDPVWGGNDHPNIMHGDGANFGFADGHADFRKWTSRKLIDYIRAGWPSGTLPLPTYADTKEDLRWLYNAIWGVVITVP
jgi:prepilin-type processing-associated H-X9-DG protein